VSDVAHESSTFFALYSEDRVTPDQIDDFVEAWHESGDDETRELHEYLGLTWEEYGVLMMTSRALPLILAARRADRPLREFVEPFFETLKARNAPRDRATLHTMSYWLYGHPPVG
jgi:hypothetical protein